MAYKIGVVAPPPTLECCMCGDYGLLEAIRCRSCHFRSQHRYCGDLYPKAESYCLCNWCLKEDGEKAMKEAIGGRRFSSRCSGSNKNEESGTRNSTGSNEVGLNLQRCSSFQLHLNNPIKKQRSLERSNAARSKQMFRWKVRRYKLLEEVRN